jgi:hypothetical protein
MLLITPTIAITVNGIEKSPIVKKSLVSSAPKSLITTLLNTKNIDDRIWMPSLILTGNGCRSSIRPTEKSKKSEVAMVMLIGLIPIFCNRRDSIMRHK